MNLEIGGKMKEIYNKEFVGENLRPRGYWEKKKNYMEEDDIPFQETRDR